MCITIVYFCKDKTKVHPYLVPDLGRDTNSTIILCDNISELIYHFNNACTVLQTLVLVEDEWIKNNSTVDENISMISTIKKLTCPEKKIVFAATITRRANIPLSKSLRKTDMAGIVPFPGVLGYKETVRGIKELLLGKSHWPHLTADQDIVKPDPTIIQLTTRQKEITNLITDRGLSNKRIANILKISESTVKVHISAILKTCCLKNRTQLALFAKDHKDILEHTQD